MCFVRVYFDLRACVRQAPAIWYHAWSLFNRPHRLDLMVVFNRPGSYDLGSSLVYICPRYE